MRIYFSGIGGVGIGPLAEIAADAGYDVLGSDQSRSLHTDELEKRSITISYSQDGQFLDNQHANQPIDWLVYTAALPDDHPELVLARQLGIKTAKRDELLAHIISQKNLKLIAVTGTHGKTTTTGMMVWALQQLGLPVSYSIGSTISFGPSGKYDPASQYFVYECDEFDRNFLHFEPYLSLITSIDHDHFDTYPTASDYSLAFNQFITQSSQTIMWQSDLKSEINPPANAWVLGTNEIAPDIRLAGLHNRANASLVAKAIEYLQVAPNDPSVLTGVLNSFPGTNRRFENLAPNLYSDYGHHPREIKATLQLAKELTNDVVLVYQPHQNVRQHEIINQYTDDIFTDATQVYWLPTYLSRENPNQAILQPQQLAAQLDDKSKLVFADLNQELWQAIQEATAKDSLVVAMGAGTIDSWLRQQLTN